MIPELLSPTHTTVVLLVPRKIIPLPDDAVNDPHDGDGHADADDEAGRSCEDIVDGSEKDDFEKIRLPPMRGSVCLAL